MKEKKWTDVQHLYYVIYFYLILFLFNILIYVCVCDTHFSASLLLKVCLKKVRKVTHALSSFSDPLILLCLPLNVGTVFSVFI